MGELVVRCRAVGVLTVLAGLSAPVLWLAGPLLQPPRPSFDSTLAALLAWLLLFCWAWLALCSAVVAAETLATGRARWSRRFAPRFVRTLVTAACGAGLAAGLAAPSYADTGVHSLPQLRVLDGLPLPDRAPGATPPARHTPSVTVVRGDTLSAIAEAHGTAWPALYRANRDLIGADPDLIHPGMQLTLPHHSTEGPAS